MSRQLCHRATTHPFICSRLGERKKGGGSIFLCRRMKKTSRSRYGSCWRLNARRGASVAKHIFAQPAFSSSSSSPLPSVCSSFERVFSHSMPPFFPPLFSSQMGAQYISQLGDSDFPATSPPSPQTRGYKSPNPFTPRCGIGLKKPDFAQRSDHHPPAVPKNQNL